MEKKTSKMTEPCMFKKLLHAFWIIQVQAIMLRNILKNEYKTGKRNRTQNKSSLFYNSNNQTLCIIWRSFYKL